MLDYEQFKRDGKTFEEILAEAIKHTLLPDYQRAEDMLILDDMFSLSTQRDTFTNGEVSQNSGFRPK
jgi:hypothetical protein